MDQKRPNIWLRRLLQAIGRWLFHWLGRVQVIGLENVPAKGGFILATNHLSRLDPALIFSLVKRDDLTALVAEKYQYHPIFKWLVNAAGGIYINRGEADLHALRAARELLRNGGGLGIAPEGTRSQTGRLIPAKTGVAYLADKAGVPLIPVAVYGTENAISQLFHLRRPPVVIQFGEPFWLPPLPHHGREAALQRNTDEMMCRIAAMLPARYRGFYADHPRLHELLAGTDRLEHVYANAPSPYLDRSVK